MVLVLIPTPPALGMEHSVSQHCNLVMPTDCKLKGETLASWLEEFVSQQARWQHCSICQSRRAACRWSHGCCLAGSILGQREASL